MLADLGDHIERIPIVKSLLPSRAVEEMGDRVGPQHQPATVDFLRTRILRYLSLHVFEL